MSGTFIDEGEVKSTALDDSGEVVCKILLPGGQLIEGVRLRLPAGFQAMPVDDDDGHDALALRDGDLVEVLTAVDREVTKALPKLQKGQTRIHSLEKLKAQLISILANEILVGKDATRGGARLNDEVGGGVITISGASSGPPPTVALSIIYTNAKGATTTWGPVTFLGVITGTPVVTFSLLELIKTASSLVKVE